MIYAISFFVICTLAVLAMLRRAEPGHEDQNGFHRD